MHVETTASKIWLIFETQWTKDDKTTTDMDVFCSVVVWDLGLVTRPVSDQQKLVLVL